MATTVTWDTLDWSVLDRLRQGFISGSAAEGPYWQSAEDLAHYDLTYAERIGWKWDHVLHELQQRGWSPGKGTLLDWGCGSGVAHRRVLDCWPEAVSGVQVFDHSTHAEQFSLRQISQSHPDLPAQSWRRTDRISTLVVSHVLNELDEDSAEDLMSAIETAETVLWVEPGTSEVAHQLVEWRERLTPQFDFVYPCPHQGPCGILASGNERHWCHHFASPPAGVFADSRWVKFGQRAGIDLRSLPYSALVMQKPKVEPERGDQENVGRIIGRPKVSKPFTRFVACDGSGVTTLELPKKLAPALAKKLDRTTAARRFQWRHEQGKLTQIKPTS
ncbi:MAG: hypothetical protein SynsKO_40540 [Synoicihabitans sp.]